MYLAERRLNNWFALFRRDLVTDGTWAELFTADGGLACSVLPVLLALDHGRFMTVPVLRERVRILSGLRSGQLTTARRTLACFGFVRIESVRGGSWTVDVNPDLCHVKKLARLPGAIIASGEWAVLRPEERSICIALLALAKGYWWDEEDSFSQEELAFLDSEGAWDILEDCYERETPILRDVGVTDAEDLAAAAGVEVGTAGDALTALHAKQLVAVMIAKARVVYHLPSWPWRSGGKPRIREQ